jgi:hypothetical protein
VLDIEDDARDLLLAKEVVCASRVKPLKPHWATNNEN